jgi:hypothetical protein
MLCRACVFKHQWGGILFANKRILMCVEDVKGVLEEMVDVFDLLSDEWNFFKSYFF